jgi:hypothetical protein
MKNWKILIRHFIMRKKFKKQLIWMKNNLVNLNQIIYNKFRNIEKKIFLIGVIKLYWKMYIWMKIELI